MTGERSLPYIDARRAWEYLRHGISNSKSWSMLEEDGNGISAAGNAHTVR